MTDVPDLVWVSVAAPIGNSDHSSLSVIISMTQAVPNLSVSSIMFLKNQENFNTVCGAMLDLPCRNIWPDDNPVEVLNVHLLLLVGHLVPTKVIRVRNKDKPWFDDQCKHAFGLKQEAHLWWTRDCSWVVNWEDFVRFLVRANETYSAAKRQFSAIYRDILINAQSTHKWWSTLKSAVFSLSLLLPPHVGGGGGQVCESVGKADLLLDHFNGKWSRESVDLPFTCHPSLRLTTLACRSSKVRRFFLDLDPWLGPVSVLTFILGHLPIVYVSSSSSENC